MPDEARRRREAADDGRHVHVHTGQVSFEGTVWVQAEVDLADALDLDTALSAGAARLADLGSAASLDVRRSEALGEMARHQLSLDLNTGTETDAGPGSGPGGGAARAPLRGRDHGTRTRSCTWPGWRTPARFVDAEQVRAWCGRPGTTVTVRPVVDLAERIAVEPVRGSRPARRPGSRAGPGVRVPVVHPPRRGLRPGPRDPLQRGRHRPAATTSRPCAVATTGSRPTTPAGATPCWNPAATCGPHRTATSSCATTPAPPTSPATGHRTHPTE